MLASTMLTGAALAATLDIAIDSSPAGLDQHLITAFNSVVIVQSNIYEGLTAIDKNLAVVPALAESNVTMLYSAPFRGQRCGL